MAAKERVGNERNVVVVTPTYNEKDNIQTLLDAVFSLEIPNLRMLIVDDNSPDKTGEIADSLAKKYPLTVIHRKKKEGLGPAYIEAFEEVIKQKPDFIIHMDADLSHDPKAIPFLLKEISRCDVVFGSRYVRGGNVKNWNMSRRLLSRASNIYARLILGVPYKDLTSGFRCYRREVLENVEFTTLSSIGYSFLIEMAFRAHQKKYKIHEVPITFVERKSGSSKLNIAIAFESFFKVISLRLRGW